MHEHPASSIVKYPILPVVKSPKIYYRINMKLTDQQMAIVQHTTGPALVFAVAGSGKTTSMVQRIKHLVERRMVPAEQILATSFNNSAVRDIIEQLKAVGVKGKVNCRTLHALGYHVIYLATQRGYLDKIWLRKQRQNPEDLGSRLIGQVLSRMAQEDGCDVNDLNIDREDLKNQISIWKANLVYPDAGKIDLPAAAREFVETARHDHEPYLRAYRNYEALRIAEKIITFDDMLMTGWELLMRHPDILKGLQQNYRMVMVDEFQDLNFAQYRIIDEIIRPHGNYMAIGDDDQCIYQWRGANPRFILDFEKHYRAKVYTISDNFRSCAQQILLANRIIVNNRQRYPKLLSLTRGFGGATFIHQERHDGAVASAIVGEIRKLFKQGKTASDLAVLIRLYSQTAFLETELIAAGIPYRIEGSSPFYARDELVVLFQYLAFAGYEREIRQGGFWEDAARVEKYFAVFPRIINRPRRFVAKAFLEAIVKTARHQRRSAIETMLLNKGQLKRGSLNKVLEFVDVINQLINRLKKPAHKTLKWLVEETGYREHLVEISGMYELGVSRIQNVDALIEFAKTRGNCGDFLDYIRDISLHAVPNPQQVDPVRIMTIYKAKGLEWETVFVPGCNAGLMPCVMADSEGKHPDLVSDVEAERRLFYVAVTRARETLHLYHAADKPLTPFLQEIDGAKVLEEVALLQGVLEKRKSLFREKELLRFCRLVGEYHLARYLQRWAEGGRARREHVRALIDGLEQKLQQADAAQAQYQEACRAYEEAKARFAKRHRQLAEALQRRPVVMRKFKSAFYALEIGEKVRFERFQDGDVMVLGQRGLVGVVAFERMDDFPRDALIWESCAARLQKALAEEQYFALQLASLTLNPVHPEVNQAAPEPPKDLPEKTRVLLDADFRAGFAALKAFAQDG